MMTMKTTKRVPMQYPTYNYIVESANQTVTIGAYEKEEEEKNYLINKLLRVEYLINEFFESKKNN